MYYVEYTKCNARISQLLFGTKIQALIWADSFPPAARAVVKHH
jgi:hypothetical protein